ncbi:MAG: glycosyltransferase family 4 protein, partial [Anaerolineae bacterium]|nr:glycosyltransferase family 4 protein [Anaerolineae bacterium]
MAHWHIGSLVIDGRYIQDHFPGIGRYTYNLIDALARIAPDERFVVLYNPALKNTRYDIAALARYPNIELVRVNVPTISVSEQYRLLSAISRQPSAVGGQRSVIFHSPYYIKPYFLTVPSIVTIFDLIPLLFPHTVSLRARFFFRWAVWLAAKTSARVIVPSLATHDDLIAHLRVPREKIVVIPLAADAHFAPQSDAEIARVREKYALPARYVLYVGSNKPHKNLATLFDAWARVETDAVLVIAGAWDARYARVTDDRRRMTDDASASVGVQQSAVVGRQEAGGAGQSQIANRKSQIRFIHNVDDADLPALYAGARAFVFPSLYEGFGLPPLEAMASGAPVICSRAPALPEVVGDTALLVNPRSPNEIANAIERVLTDHELRDTLRARGLVRAAQFSWERAARATSGS